MRRRGFTLIEMLVAFALILFIMVILTEAFGSALRAFRQLKALGDMESDLRTAGIMLRRELAADHFDGRRRLSDPWGDRELPREGFFRFEASPAVVNEGTDADNIPSRRTANHLLHFSVKLRGNERPEFFSARLPSTSSPLLSWRTTFFDHPSDARFQEVPSDPNRLFYNSQWAEVAYFLQRQPGQQTPGGVEIYNLYRSQFVAVAANMNNGNQVIDLARGEQANYAEFSCQADDQIQKLFFNTPRDLVKARYLYRENNRDVPRRAFDPNNPMRATTPLLMDVLSFEIQPLVGGEFVDMSMFDTGMDEQPRPRIQALKITLRVWHRRTEQTRQMTFVQDL